MEQLQSSKKTGLFSGLSENKGYVVKASLLCLFFWLLQFLYQFYLAGAGTVSTSLIRSFAFAGATLISIALIIGPLARLTKHNFLQHRRTVGVWGFTFVILHFLEIMASVFKFNFSSLFWNTDPFVNLLIFGLAGFIIFIPLYLTSTDSATRKLGFRKWKAIHRLAYIAYIFSVLHYLNINPAALSTIPGYFLLAATGIAILLQLVVFAKTILKTRNMKDLAVGIIIILFGLALFYLEAIAVKG